MTNNIFTVNYNVTGPERKALVKAICEITGAKAEYLKTPTFAYRIDYFLVDKNGALSFDDRADTEEVENLLEELEKRGFHGEPPEKPEGPTPEAEEAADSEPKVEETKAPAPKAEAPEESKSEVEEVKEPAPNMDESGEDALVGVAVSYPRSQIDDRTLENFIKLTAAKEALIKKAFGVDELPIRVTDKVVSIPWFKFDSNDTNCMAYAFFIEKMISLARSLKRVNAREKPVENEKYAFRCFLLRLGMVGKEWKDARKVLLKNLSGSSAFKGGAPK